MPSSLILTVPALILINIGLRNMEITYQDFINVCPSAMMPDDQIFKAVSPGFDDSLKFIRDIISGALLDRIDTGELTLDDPDSDRLSSLQAAVKKYICASTYLEAIPQLDLVLTSTGFGVVSNQNVAPASAERVKALCVQLTRQRDIYLDDILDFSRPFVDRDVTDARRGLFGRLFWRADQLRAFGVSGPTRSDLAERLPDIDYAAREISRKLSPELYDALCDAESKDGASSMQSILITMWRQATVAHARHDGSCHAFMEQMLRLVEDNLDEFPEYRDSQTYKANHFSRYENKKDDPCFFFG